MRNTDNGKSRLRSNGNKKQRGNGSKRRQEEQMKIESHKKLSKLEKEMTRKLIRQNRLNLTKRQGSKRKES